MLPKILKYKAWGNGSVPRKHKASNENVTAPEHPSAYRAAIVWGSLSAHQLYPGTFNMWPPFDTVQENKIVNLLPHLIKALDCFFIHYQGSHFDSSSNIQFTMHFLTLK